MKDTVSLVLFHSRFSEFEPLVAQQALLLSACYLLLTLLYMQSSSWSFRRAEVLCFVLQSGLYYHLVSSQIVPTVEETEDDTKPQQVKREESEVDDIEAAAPNEVKHLDRDACSFTSSSHFMGVQ